MRVIPARGVCSFVKRGNDQVRRIRIILFSVKLRVLNPKLFLKPPHKTNKRDKKRHIHITDAHTSSRMFASSCAQVVVSPPKKVRAFTSSFRSVLVVASLWVSGG